MDLHLPGGASLIDATVGTEHRTTSDLASGDAVLRDVTPAQLDDAIGALHRGDIEYLALHDTPGFLQVAGEGAGPYQIERNPGDIGDQVRVPGGVTDEAMRYALHACLAGDPTWAQHFPWEDAGLGRAPVDRERPRRHRLFGGRPTP